MTSSRMTIARAARIIIMGAVFGLLLFGGMTVFQSGWSPESILTGCANALDVREPILRPMIVDYRMPCLEYFYGMSGLEFANQVRLNNYGFNDDHFSLRRLDGVTRIVVLGDELVDASSVARAVRFDTLIETRLTASGRPVELYNLGTPGLATDREVLVYSVLGGEFAPDTVILVVNLRNDILGNSIALQWQQTGTFSPRPHFGLRDDGALALVNSQLVSPFISQTPPYTWLLRMQDRQLTLTEPVLPDRPRLLRESPRQFEYPVEYGVYLPDDATWAEAWAITEQLILALDDNVTAQGAGFGVVIVPDKVAISDASWNAATQGFSVLRDADRSAPARRLEAFLTAHDIPYANLALTFERWQATNPVDERLYWVYDDGLSLNGHAVVADRLANWILAEGFATNAETAGVP